MFVSERVPAVLWSNVPWVDGGVGRQMRSVVVFVVWLLDWV